MLGNTAGDSANVNINRVICGFYICATVIYFIIGFVLMSL